MFKYWLFGYSEVMNLKTLRSLGVSCGLAAALLAGCGYVQESGPESASAGTATPAAAVSPGVLSRSALQEHEQWEESRLSSLAGTPTPTPTPTPAPDAEEGITRLLFVGDTLEYRGGSLNFGSGLENNLEEALPLLRSADLVILNHEAAPCAADYPRIVRQTGYKMGINPESLIALRDSGVPLAVNLANNHAGNYGLDCLVSGISRLREAGIPVFGAGLDIEDAEEPYVFEDRGNAISLLGYLVDTSLVLPWWLADEGSPGTLAFTPERLASGILASPQDSFAVVMLHQGSEYLRGVTGAQLETASTVVEGGADLIIGAHPHIIEPFLTVNGVPYFSSIGNGVMDQCSLERFEESLFSPTRESLILEVQVRDNEVYAIIPHLFYQWECRAGNQRLAALDPSVPSDQAIIADMMERLIPPGGFNADGYGIDATVGSGRFSSQDDEQGQLPN